MSSVIIVGAGPVGMLTALCLARAGVACVILERASDVASAGSRAICVERSNLAVLRDLGCERILSEGSTLRRASISYRDRKIVTTHLGGGETDGLPPYLNLPQARTNQILLAAVRAAPSIEVRFRHELAGIEQDETGVTATFETPEGARHHRARYLVGADGAGSTVRTLLGIDFPGTTFPDRFLIADIEAELPADTWPRDERCFFFAPPFHPDGNVLAMAVGQAGSTWRIDWQVSEDVDGAEEQAHGALDLRVRQIIGDTPYRLVWLTQYKFHERLATTFQKGRVFLAGDAAHLVAPFGAHGMNSGLADAVDLAGRLTAEEGLAGYTAERRAAAAHHLGIVHETMRFLAPQTSSDRERRDDVLSRSLTDPAARQLIDAGKLYQPYRAASVG